MTDPITELVRETEDRKVALDTLFGMAQDSVRLTVNPHISPCTCTVLELVKRGWPAEMVKHAKSCPRH